MHHMEQVAMTCGHPIHRDLRCFVRADGETVCGRHRFTKDDWPCCVGCGPASWMLMHDDACADCRSVVRERKAAAASRLGWWHMCSLPDRTEPVPMG